MAFVSMFGLGFMPDLAEGTSSFSIAILTEDRANMASVPVSIVGLSGSYSVSTDASGRARIDVASGSYSLTPTVQGDYDGGATQTVDAQSREGYLVTFDLRLPRVSATALFDVSASAWVSDTTHEEYGYRCAIPVSDLTASDYVEVVYGAAEATSGNYAPICETYDGGLYLFSKTSAAVTVSTILIMKGVRT